MTALVVAVFALTAGTIAAPAGAAPSASISRSGFFSSAGSYVALGDSYTSGQGAPPYKPGTCYQSKYASYPAIASALSRYRLTANNACSGATLAQLPAQYASAVSPSTKMVTLTIGAIDAGSNQIVAACAPNPSSAQCVEALSTSLAGLPQLGANLAMAYAALAAAAPNAKIVVLNYPRLFQAGVSPLGDQVNLAADALNATIAAAVVGAANSRVVLVDVTQEFQNHGIGSQLPYIAYNAANPFDAASFHPNALGNLAGYGQALAKDRIFR